ncbi:hypothetical protein DMUE_3627 [Dictyocoela muelleri]|nr:hypothetical protein DMUE_3627 [Dictyocoela muelleri]
MVKNSLRGKMIHWFNAFDGEEFTDLYSFIIFFKEEFRKEEEDYDIKAWEFIIKGPKYRNILEFAYELKSLCKNAQITLKTIKNKIRDCINKGLHEKINECENWKSIFDVLKNEKINERNIFSSKSFFRKTYRSHSDNVMTLECIKSDNPNKFEIKVKGISEYEALIDTGANSSFLSKKTFEKEKLKLLGKPITIKQAVGSFKTMGYANWYVKNRSHNGNIKFHVVENSDRDIIFGCDGIRILKIDIKSHLYSLKNVNIKDSVYKTEIDLDIGDENLKNNSSAVRDICEDYKEIFSGDGKVDTLEFEHTIELLDVIKIFLVQNINEVYKTKKLLKKKFGNFLKKT